MKLTCKKALPGALLACLCAVGAPPLAAQDAYYRGDCNSSREPSGMAVNIADPIAAISFLFRGTYDPQCLDACDADDNGELDLSDIVFLIEYLFRLGPFPPSPGPGFSVVCGFSVQLPGPDRHPTPSIVTDMCGLPGRQATTETR